MQTSQHSTSTEARRRRQAGTASVEAVLCLPILLAIFFLADHTARTFMIKQDVNVIARTMVWSDAINGLCVGIKNNKFGKLPDVSLFDRCANDSILGLAEAPIIDANVLPRENYGKQLVDEMQKQAVEGSGQFALDDVPGVPGITGEGADGDPELIRDISRASRPLVVRGSHSQEYARWWGEPVKPSTEHSVSAIRIPLLPVWSNSHWNIQSLSGDDAVLELSYDPVLREKLKGGTGFLQRADLLFKDLFPKLR
jgi:hypothetical protein